MPGAQPADGVTIESINQCTNCHSGYDEEVEPVHTWQGSMMAQAGRDPLWAASMTVALQDSIWQLGNANAGDLCIRCHSPVGWLGGRSDPPNLSALDPALGDLDGVNCASCHQMIDSIAANQQLPQVPAETIQAAIDEANITYAQDISVLGSSVLFDNSSFFNSTDELPVYYGDGTFPNYIEATSGQYFMEPDPNKKRGNRHDAAPRSHSVNYSRFHKSAQQCGTCHDVSNPALANALIAPDASATQAAGSYFHLERTYSEFMLSAYAQPGGAATNSAFSNEGIPHANSCQDCHMPTTIGKAAKQNTVAIRNDLRVHDLTGGNVWLTKILASIDQTASNPNSDIYNYNLLNGTRYPGAQLEVAGLQGYGAALTDGAERAEEMLERAATLKPIGKNRIRIINNTGHKLISGFPEGRRMWLQLQFYDTSGTLISEINPYEPLVIERDVELNPSYVSGAILRHDRDDLIFEAKMQSSLTGEPHSFHMVLATDRYKDNRIPPKGFDITNASARLAQPRKDGADAADYFSAAEYLGGYHDITFTAPTNTAYWEASLYYQTTSDEYIRFLRDEINGDATTLTSPTPSGESNAYIAQSDSFFTGLKDWGDAIWELWLHNGGAAPIEMTSTISPPTIQQLEQAPDGFHIEFLTIIGRTYTLEFRNSLDSGNWQTLVGPIIGDGTSVTLIDTEAPSHTQRFYRLTNNLTE
ncbi:MAG: multiheme c-type cytochrome [Opitutaceae bacterium]